MAGSFLVRFPSLSDPQGNHWRQSGIGESNEYGECLMCLLPASVLCIVLLKNIFDL